MNKEDDVDTCSNPQLGQESDREAPSFEDLISLQSEHSVGSSDSEASID